MRIVIAGGTGQVGGVLSRAFRRDGHEVIVLSRGGAGESPGVVRWDARTLGSWVKELEGADAVIGLAGKSVNCRYTRENREEIIASRVDSTRVLGQAIRVAMKPPRVWLQASTATIYAHRFDAPNDETNGILGGAEPGVPETWRFSIEVAKRWEEAAQAGGPMPQTRLVLMRSAIMLSPDRDGAFDVLLGLVRHGLGGRSGDGRQFVSWIHEFDFIRAVRWLLEHPEMDGAINLAAPNPLPNAELMAELRRAWGAPIGLPAAPWMLEIGAVLMKTETELILKSRRVVPRRLLESGFQFEYSNWKDAAAELCERWKAERRAGYSIQ